MSMKLRAAGCELRVGQQTAGARISRLVARSSQLAASPLQLAAPLAAVLLTFGMAGALRGADIPFERIKPILDEFCLTCHSTAKHKGDFDLEQHTSAAGIQRHPNVWQHVLEQIGDREMPPKDKPQPSAEQKAQLVAWIRGSLDAFALKYAGDPGPVVLRRLSNAEYTYTIRDLTGIDTLDPAKEFPVDGAAGEGFTNTGMALVMSPSLVTKFLDAGKDVARHAILTPDGLRWTAGTSRRDGTDDLLREIRAFYARFTVPGEGGTVSLQGITLDRSHGAKLPLDRYLAAALELRAGGDPAAVATARGLSVPYLTSLRDYLAGQDPAELGGGLRARWRSATAKDVPALVADIERWQRALWKFNPVGQVGMPKGPAHWQETVSPLAERQEVKLKLPDKNDGRDQVISLVAEDAGGGAQPAVVVWQEPKLILAGRPAMPLRDVGKLVDGLITRRERMIGAITKTLDAAAEAKTATGTIDSTALAAKHGVDAAVLDAWLAYLGITAGGSPDLKYLSERVESAGNHAFIRGWRTGELPSLVTNSSDGEVRIPGLVKPHGVVVHPSPQLAIAVGWRSPISGTVRVSGQVSDAHHDCGNGVTWVLERRRGVHRQRVASGIVHGKEIGPIAPTSLSVRTGDLLALVIGPRGPDHTCDLTDLELSITAEGEGARTWSLSKELSGDPLAGNPHADATGTPNIWHMYTEPVTAGEPPTAIPAGSLLARWLASDQPAEQQRLAQELQTFAKGPAPKDGADAALHRQLTSLTGPLSGPAGTQEGKDDSAWGVAANLFGRNPQGATGVAIAATDLAVQTPAVVSCHLPAELAVNCELVATATPAAAPTASAARVRAVAGAPAPARVDWWSGDASAPLLAKPEGATHRRLSAAIADLQRLFPMSLCYTRIVPVDEVVTLTLFFREDDQLKRLVLTADEAAQLDRLWQQLHFVSQDALTQVDAFEQIWQYMTQEGSPAAIEPLRKPITERAAEFRRFQIDCEPRHVEAVIAFAGNAYRRPLNDGERDGLRRLYQSLRSQEVPHDETIRLLLARVLISPGFLYKSERPAPGAAQRPVSANELATRLSYFLWSSQPDAALRSAADSLRLNEPAVLLEQMRRMLADPRMRRLASEFGCAWLQVNGVDTLDEKSERHFPTFLALRGDLQEEAVRFLIDLIQGDRSLLNVIDADHTFLTETLARHYGIPGVNGPEWRRVDGVRKFHRGGVLGLGAALAKHSGASRTSPILRGNWISEVLLGEKLPRPPKGVPQLPDDEDAAKMTMREITERHTADPKCSGCHARIDPFGYTMESFDSIGRWRDHDLADRPLNTRVTVPDGTDLNGVDGLRGYLLDKRRDAYVRQFCRKLLGFALGRGVQISDGPLLTEMQTRLAANGYRVTTAIESIILSRQFREIRGRDAVFEE